MAEEGNDLPERVHEGDRRADEYEADLSDLLKPLYGLWRYLGAIVLAVMLIAFAGTKLLLVKWYRATAILHPLESSFTGPRGFGGQFGVTGGGSVLQQLTGGGGQSQEAWEYISVLKSHAFISAIIEEHHLGPMLARHGRGTQTPWHQYEEMLDRFDAQFELKSGNISLHFDDPDPATAQLVLGYFIDRLREKLRIQQVDESKAAAQSLQEEAEHTSDSLLQDRLFEMVAQQRQRLVVAQVQADFAFKVIEPPVVPDRAFWPSGTLNAIFAGIATFILFSGVVLVRERFRSAKSYSRQTVIGQRDKGQLQADRQTKSAST